MLQTLLDFIFPRRSLTGEEGEFVTADECLSLKSFSVIEEVHVLQGRGIHYLDAIRAGSSYHHAPLLKKAIHTFKFKRIPGLADHLASIIMSAPHPEVPKGAVLCPVPLHWSRRFQRGFNQAELLAEKVSVHTGIPISSLLSRVRATGFQSHRKRAERLISLKDAFRCREKSPSFVVLIDDLATTGATLDACAKVLKERGASHVEAWVVSHG